MLSLPVLCLCWTGWLVGSAIAPHPPMPICPKCHTVTELTATEECRIPPCTGLASPTVACTRTLDLRQTTTTVVANSDVCPYTPTVTELSRCPAATACNEVDCALVTLGEWTTDVTRFITNCRPASTPWSQPTPDGFTPEPTRAPPAEPTEDVVPSEDDGNWDEGSWDGDGGTYEDPPFDEPPMEQLPPPHEEQSPIDHPPWPTVDHLHPDPTPGPQPTPMPAPTPRRRLRRATASTTTSLCAVGESTTVTQGLCPTYSCARPTEACGADWTSPTHEPTSQTAVRGCTTMVLVGEQPCSMCATCAGHGFIW